MRLRRELHRDATHGLALAIGRGEVAPGAFSEGQLAAIRAVDPLVPGHVWHHHREPGRLQLVPASIHLPTSHFGERADRAPPRPGLRRAGINARVDGFERRLGIRLPDAYLEIVHGHDGGWAWPSMCPVEIPGAGRDDTGYDRLAPFFEQPDLDLTMDMLNPDGPVGLPRGLVGFALEAGGRVFAFDYRDDPATADPAVALLVNPDPSWSVAVRVAPSFAAFLAGLYDEG